MNATLATHSISAPDTADLLAVLGIVVLAIIAALMSGIELKILLKPFFLVMSLLIYYLGFRFIGDSVHSLQVAGVVSVTPVNFLLASEDLGLYPTWETTLPQLVLLMVARVVVTYTRLRAARADDGQTAWLER